MALRGRGSYNIGVKFEGNWVKFNEIVNSSNILLVMAARTGQKEFAEMYRDRVKANIRTGGKRFGYPQISGKYLLNKVRRGGPSTTLNWSGAFADSVEIRENKIGTRFMVGIPKGLKRPQYYASDKNRLSISEYANVLEHGTKNVPPRPVFSDTFEKDMAGKLGLKRYIELAMIRKYGSVGVTLNKS